MAIVTGEPRGTQLPQDDLEDGARRRRDQRLGERGRVGRSRTPRPPARMTARRVTTFLRRLPGLVGRSSHRYRRDEGEHGAGHPRGTPEPARRARGRRCAHRGADLRGRDASAAGDAGRGVGGDSRHRRARGRSLRADDRRRVRPARRGPRRAGALRRAARGRGRRRGRRRARRPAPHARRDPRARSSCCWH